MTADLSEAEWGFLQTNLQAGEYAFFCGAGFSRAAGLLTAPELARRMASKLYARAESDEIALERFREEYNYKGEFSLAGVADIIEANFGRRKLIRHLRNCTFWRAAPSPSPVHQGLYLASIAVEPTGWPLRIVTPNYDTLTADALQPRVAVIVTEEDHESARVTLPWVLKIHGCFAKDPEATIVITTEDLRQQLPAWKERALDTCVRGRGLVIVGYGAGDSHLNYAIVEAISRAGRSKESYWVSPTPPPDDIRQTLDANAGRHLPMTAEAFFENTNI